MKKTIEAIVAACLLLLATTFAEAQVGIGTATPDSKAALEVQSTTKGFLPPRMNNTQRDAIASPPAGLTIYNTEVKSFQVYNGTAWYSTVHYIGENYGGGTVFYVYDNGQHGLIASASDLGPVEWGATNFGACFARASGIGAGQKNTALIMAWNAGVYGGTFGVPQSIAARLCNDHTVTSAGVTYGDWYLPSAYEMGLMVNQNTILGLNPLEYWTSNESTFDALNSAVSVDVGSGLVNEWTNKGDYKHVRPIRAF